MIEAVTFEQVVLSVVANAVGLCVVTLMRSAPPRVTLYVCLASMSAVLVPWPVIGGGVAGYLSVNTFIGLGSEGASTLVVPPEAAVWPFESAIIVLWLGVGIAWCVTTIVGSARTKRRWRALASCGSPIAEHADPVFARELRRVRIRRLPDTSLVFSTGLWRPEIWVGERVRTRSHLRAALNHELCHIASNDHSTLLIVVVVERLLWWNPLIWLLGRQARRQMEYACDAHCQALIGTTEYRQSLAELFLGRQPRNAALEISLGTRSDVITRMEKIGMTHSFKLKHAFTLMVGATLIATASTNLAAQGKKAGPTLIQCHDLLPEGVQYDFRIASDIDTRDGRKGTVTVTLLDATRPDSHEVPPGAGEFLRCVQKVVGVGDSEGWPEV